MRKTLFGVAVALSLGAPAAARAATVTSAGFTAGKGEANRLIVGHTTPFGVPYTDHGAPIQVGAGCIAGTPILCGDGQTDANVTLGDRDDIADVDPFWTDAHVSAGEGDDDVAVNGSSSSVAGNSGDDILSAEANGDAIASGGTGDDVVMGHTFSNDSFSGGTGDDLVMPLGPAIGTSTGDRGDDVLITDAPPGSHGGVVLDGGPGADIVTYLTSPTRIGAVFVGGNGHDTLVGPAGSVDGGAGNDTIDVTGGVAPSTVTCGAGRDVVYADADDSVADDCEQRLSGPAPTFPAVEAARARAQAMATHVPNP